jgi:fructosamine-3-kinase
MRKEEKDLLIQHLTKVTGKSLKNASFYPIHGGSINQSYQLKTDNFSWFIKLNHLALEFMFVTEAEGLKELAQTQTINIPKVIAYGNSGQQSYLILEYLSLNTTNVKNEAKLGRKLAQLHAKKQPFYGWHIDNTIGKTPQYNQPCDNWVTFWQQQRLSKQLSFAAQNGYTGKLQIQGEKLCASINQFFTSYQPQASLVHGDLWAGNAAFDETGNPIVFDPACYYGDREVDLAMSELFGGFGGNFYAAYENEWSLDEGYPTRKMLYNLYHILNHLNLFGESYECQAINMMNQLLAEL